MEIEMAQEEDAKQKRELQIALEELAGALPSIARNPLNDSSVVFSSIIEQTVRYCEQAFEPPNVPTLLIALANLLDAIRTNEFSTDEEAANKDVSEYTGWDELAAEIMTLARLEGRVRPA
jgi:hypothetical protein